MSRFIVRIELSGSPSHEDCAALHDALKKERFVEIKGWSSEGDRRHAEYSRKSIFGQNHVRNSAVKAAKTVGQDFGVVVSSASGLQKAQQFTAIANVRFITNQNQT
ncbi:hypothetical protein BH09VER1_BH09VER1_45570 [soil metagenome]